MKTIQKKVFTALLFIAIPILSSAQEEGSMTLKQVIMVSRHSVRAPLQENIDTLKLMVPVADTSKWKQWSVEGSDLTLRGAALETLMGEYFKLYFAKLKPEFELDSSNIYFGCSSKNRTIATARSFAAGLLPYIAVPINYQRDTSKKYGIGAYDPTYLPMLNYSSCADFDTASFKDEAKAEIAQIQAPSFRALERVLNFKKSTIAKRTGSPHFGDSVHVEFNFWGRRENGSVGRLEPTLLGDFKLANRAADALILQYFEVKDKREAALGHKLCEQSWEQIALVKDRYTEALFSAPIVAVNVSHEMIKKIWDEITGDSHKFVFLTTHDTMIYALLKALQVESYELPNTIEKLTPIGGKVLIEKWMDAKGDYYIRTRYVYQSSEQLREMQALDANNPPMSYDLNFQGLNKTPDGVYYDYEDFLRHIKRTIKAYEATAKGRHPFQD